MQGVLVVDAWFRGGDSPCVCCYHSATTEASSSRVSVILLADYY